MELSETTKLIFERVQQLNPTRVVIDSLSELRLLAQSPLRYRRQVLALKHFFASGVHGHPARRPVFGRRTTCSCIRSRTASCCWNSWRSTMARSGVACASSRCAASSSAAAITISRSQRAACEVFPRLVAAEHHTRFTGEFAPSGNADLDALLGGGLERGTNALLIGAAGVGKSSLALTYAIAAAQRGEHAVFFAFDEGRGTLEARARTLGLPLDEALASGRIRFQQIDPAELSPGEFAASVRASVEADGARSWSSSTV